MKRFDKPKKVTIMADDIKYEISNIDYIEPSYLLNYDVLFHSTDGDGLILPYASIQSIKYKDME